MLKQYCTASLQKQNKCGDDQVISQSCNPSKDISWRRTPKGLSKLGFTRRQEVRYALDNGNGKMI
jgi:hypothetical protein